MKKRTFVLITLALSLLCLSFFGVMQSRQAEEAFGKGVIKRGASGGDVWELQGRLQYLGYYKGKVDGKFGWGTYWAVRNFQSRFGIKVDGTVGPKTKLKLWEATKKWKPTGSKAKAAGIKKGAVGGQVWELQGRLKHLGFYKGKIDGRFGWGTYWAVRNFQHKFGMKVDGVVGSQTMTKLRRATKNWNAKSSGSTPARRASGTTKKAHGMSENDIRIMANAVHGEARGEPYVGQVAVAAVILNRVESASFPNTPSGVIFEPRAFTAVADGQIWLTPNKQSKKAVRDALNGWDPTGGAIYYFNPDTATSGWIWTRPQIKKIGKHIFCK